MSSKTSRHSPSPSSPPAHNPSKLPKFLQKQANRDRSRSVTDPSRSPSTLSLASGNSASSPEMPSTPSSSTTRQSRKSSKFLGIKDKDKDEKARRSSEILVDTTPNANPSAGGNADSIRNEMDEPPVIVEPVNIPRPRTRSERPLSTASDMPQNHMSLYASTSSTSRIGDLPTRLSGWFSQTFSTSSTDLSLPTLLSQAQSASSPKAKGSSSALLTAAKHGKGHLDKAVRYLLDSDSVPDKCTDPIWLLGVQHPGYEPPPPPPPTNSLNASTSSANTRRGSGSPPSFRSSTSSSSMASTTELSLSQSGSGKPNPAANWPPVFYDDFTSRVWLTYRSQFPPIRDTRLADLPDDPADVSTSPTTVKRPWNWTAEKGWTNDSGWGCMLRTGQSLLANALVHLHLGRDWRRPPYPVATADYATYIQIVTWFLDTPSPEAPFSVHRMALAGKELGKDVGQWFGPSTAAGAIKTLVRNYPESGLGVSVATDGVLFQSDVFAASNGNGNARSPTRHAKKAWGDRPVLLLLGIRLGLDGVNPIYYDTIKQLYTFPQSVGIAGGRPSSSYYFVGSQADNLFYLDPHHARPAIPLRPAPPMTAVSHRETTPESDREWGKSGRNNPRLSSSVSHHQRVPTSPSSVRTGSSTFSYHAPLSPSPLQQQFSTSSAGSSSGGQHSSRSPPPSQQQHGTTRRRQSASLPASPDLSSDMDHRELMGLGAISRSASEGGLDPVQEHLTKAYSPVELRTFHCDRVRKMPLSGLDPSMLIGFLCRDEADWLDFRKRVGELPRTIFSIQDEPPTWPSDSDDNMGLESISEPDDLDMDIDDDEEGEQFFDTRSGSASTSSASHGPGERSKSEDIDTEEDPVDPITPGPGSRFEIGQQTAHGKGLESGKDADEFGIGGDGDDETFDDDDIEDDWVDPSCPTPLEPSPPPAVPAKDRSLPSNPVVKIEAPPMKKSKSNGSTKKKSKKGSQVPVPVPIVRLPTPSNQQPQEHFPFPVTQRAPEDSPPVQEERSRTTSNKGTNGKRMHTARARDGGRTQSGGVKGVLTDD